MSVGIERLGVYTPQYGLRLADLAVARGVEPAKFSHGLGVQEMAVAPPWEDVVTMAATAGARVLRAGHVDPASIGLLLVATETAVDHAKPVSIFVHDLLGIGQHCRTYELKHACYAGTAALMTAADWVRAGGARPRRALVIATDIARYELGSAGEPTQGAGAVAMLVGTEPQALILGEETGTYAANVYDFWRPLGRREAIVDGQHSVESYLAALAGAFGMLRALERPAFEPDEVFQDRLARILYHTPFPKMAMKAHRRLAELDWRASRGRWAAVEPRLEEAAAASYVDLAAPGLTAVARIGNTYTASLYLCLAALLEAESRMLTGRRLGLFSYGSGSCAEFFTGLVPTSAPRVSDTGIATQLRDRTLVDVPTYERLVTTGDAGGEPAAGFAGEFVFHGVRNDRREYGHVQPVAARASA